MVYAADGSAFDPDEPTEEARAFQEYCAAAGWHPAAAQAQMRVFYHEDPTAVPMETDAAAQVETIHRAMGKTSCPGASFSAPWRRRRSCCCGPPPSSPSGAAIVWWWGSLSAPWRCWRPGWC
ncbi:MAG: hypothetical protein IJ713_06660 [Oscillibacter sp.]|nr:hypothetical protein [Oscillibacter sp.]